MMSHEILSSTRSDPFGSSQITFPVDMGKNVYIVSENGSYGFLLRHFSIRESHEVNNKLSFPWDHVDRMSLSILIITSCPDYQGVLIIKLS